MKTVFRLALRRGRVSFLIWTGCVAAMLALCVLLFPEMKGSMDGVSQMFADMGDFTAAFGMDKLNFGTIMGFYGIECGNVMSIGGGFFAALLGIAALAGEERERTAEFLLTHPVTRQSAALGKLAAVLVQVVLFNLAAAAAGAAAIAAVGEVPDWSAFMLLHLAMLLLTVEISMLCFVISAFLRRGGAGIGIGITALLYFLNIVKNISPDADFLRYITPFAYAEPADIIDSAAIDPTLAAIGAAVGITAPIIAVIYYKSKDIS